MSRELWSKFEALLVDAQSRGASDLHLIPDEPPALRVDGVLVRCEGEPFVDKEIEELTCEMFPNFGNTGFIGTGVAEVHKSIMVGGVAARICVSRSSGDLSLAVRTLPTYVPRVEELAVPKGLVDAVASPSGLVVVSGRIGSGKSTTAYSLLDHINATRQVNIATVEDPIMYRLAPKRSLLQQREVGVDVPDVISGVRVPMLSDVDVVFVSEITSLEVLQACLTVADTGYLVITVMRADSPEQAIQRLVDVFGEDERGITRRELSRMLRCVSCQRLLPKASGKGRVAAYGVLAPDQEMRSAIAEGRDILARRTPLPEGCLDMRAEIERMAREGIISEETAREYLAGL